jgi:(2R)-ethylmalonyl-CoA mutase
VLSGSHRRLIPETMRLLRDHGVTAPVVVGGIIPEADQPELLAAGVARVYTPKDFRVSDIVAELAELVIAR